MDGRPVQKGALRVTLVLGIEDGIEPIAANGIIDPQEVEVVPDRTNYVPTDNVEFQVAVRMLVRGVPDEDLPDLYRLLKDKIRDNKENRESDKMNNTKVEHTIRQNVRKILNEILRPSYAPPKEEREEDDFFDSAPPPRPSDDDDDKATFEEIGNAVGMSTAGAKQLVDKALKRFAFLRHTLDEEEFELFVLEGAASYIEYLQSSGELSPEEIQLLKDNPSMLMDSPGFAHSPGDEPFGFRQFMHKLIRKEMKNRATQAGSAAAEEDF